MALAQGGFLNRKCSLKELFGTRVVALPPIDNTAQVDALRYIWMHFTIDGFPQLQGSLEEWRRLRVLSRLLESLAFIEGLLGFNQPRIDRRLLHSRTCHTTQDEERH